LTEQAARNTLSRHTAQPSVESEEDVMPVTVNLDAMIKREDLDVTDNEPAQVTIGTELKLGELEQRSTTYNILRKPDFQRETANWEPEKIADLITCFLDGDLIPSVIVWRSNRSGKLFVIDGAHRLSALIAWINDDFGDSGVSSPSYSSNRPVTIPLRIDNRQARTLSPAGLTAF
jgi:hypothetical protein